MARVAIALTCSAEQRAELTALATVARRRPAWWNGPRLCSVVWRVSATTRSGASLVCGRIRLASGAGGLPQPGWPGCGTGRGPAGRRAMAPISGCGCCANWSCRRPRGWPVGTGRRSPRRWGSRTMRSGACCVGKASNCAGAARGASAPTRNLRSRPRYHRPLCQPAGTGAGPQCRREADHPEPAPGPNRGVGARPRLCPHQQRQGGSGPQEHLQTP